MKGLQLQSVTACASISIQLPFASIEANVKRGYPNGRVFTGPNLVT